MICPIKTKNNYENYQLIPKIKIKPNVTKFRKIGIHIVPMEINYLTIISPYTIKSQCYINKELVYENPPYLMIKYVTFKSNVDICIIKEKVDRMLSMSYYRDLIGKCSRSHKKIYTIINNITNNFLIPLNKDPEDPIQINDPNRRWDEDESPFEILSKWKEEPSFIKDHLNALERKSKLLEDDFLGQKITIELPEINVDGNCFQGILQVRLSGKKFHKLSDDDLNNKIKEINFHV